MKIAVKQVGLFMQDFGPIPQVTAKLVVEVDGRKAEGAAWQWLAPDFFTGAPGAPYREQIAGMLHVIETACDFAQQVTAGKQVAESVFDLWQRVYMEQAKWANGEGYAAELWMMGLSVMERAVIDAVCEKQGATVAQATRTNLLGLRLGEMHAELAEFTPAQLLPAEPLAEVTAANLMALDDVEVFRMFAPRVPAEGPVMLHGGGRFATVGALRELWEKLRAMPEYAGLLGRVAWISQPLPREAAMSLDTEDALWDWTDRPAILVDESNCGITSAAEALETGYAGVLHRDCRGVMKGIADACLMEHRRRTEPGERAVLGVADSIVIGAAGRARDLASAASLGISPLVLWMSEAVSAALAAAALDRPAVPLDQWTYEPADV